MEKPTHEQQFEKDFIDAEVLARKANSLFDNRLEMARLMASTLSNSEYDQYSAELTEVDKRFDVAYKAAVILMPSRTAFEIPEPIEPFACENVWNAMSKEQRLEATALRTAMAEKLSKLGITKYSLRVVMHESENSERTFTLIHSGNGIDIGDHNESFDQARSYNAVMSRKNDDLFTIKVNEKKYDMRSGMTSSAYDALYKDTIRQKYVLPDSNKMASEHLDQWTWTMLTGEPLTADGNVQFRAVVGGRVYRAVCPPGDGSRNLRVRPAVVIE